jgi:hypothetical protein
MSDYLSWTSDDEKTVFTAKMRSGKITDPQGFAPGRYYVQIVGDQAEFYGPIDISSIASISTSEGSALLMGKSIPHAGTRTIRTILTQHDDGGK